MTYRIQHRITTLAELWEQIEYKEFIFNNWDFNLAEGPHGHGWIVERCVEAATGSEALGIFRSQLIPMADRIAFVSQCFVSVEPEPFLIQRIDDRRFFFRFVQQVGPVPLHFGQDELASLAALETFEEKGDVFRLLRESGNASTYLTRLSMLTAALEAISATHKGIISSNKRYIKNEILQDDGLYEELFKWGSGVRNKLFHGAQLDLGQGRNYVQDIYWKIVEFFNQRHGTRVNKAVVQPQRHPFGNFQGSGIWLEGQRADYVPQLRSLWQDFDEQERNHVYHNHEDYRHIDAQYGY